ncbi:hypothetical protein D5086_014431 [Populus alba]|uniref:Uncharacterized protein n=1 Tax=Populus alba TaxID=43335 RepID=A0ACC4BXM9_POPAL
MYYQGDAVPFGGHIEFNLVDYINRVGWATYPERVRLWDSSSGQLSDFTSHFSFTINTLGSPRYGHGIAFFLAPVGFQIPPNSAGGFLGLFNTTTMKSPQSQIVSVEFDSFSNDGWDPEVGHVGINNNSISSAVYTPWNASFHSGDTAEAWITYNSTDRNLSVFWNYQTTSDPRENSSLFYIIDLSKFLPEWVTVGFSAATGSYVEQQRLLSWEFNSSLNVKEMKGNKNSKKSRIIIPVIVSVLVLIAGATTAFVILWRRKQMMTRKRAAEKMTSINEDLERGAGPRRFSYDDLVSATNNFSDQRKLGEGGFGAVYRGYLNDMDMEIAVKKISRSSRQGKKEYITEFQSLGCQDTKAYRLHRPFHLRHESSRLGMLWRCDGMSFFIAPLDSPIPQDSSGGLLALLSPRTASSASKENQIVAVEFDSKKDIEWDPSDDHAGIDVNSIVSVASVNWKSSIKTGSKANAWVSYNSTTKNLSVFLTYAENPEFGGNSSLHYIIDLREFLPEWVRIGFSASTGDWVEIHNILSWTFESSLDFSDKKKTGLVVGLAVGIGVLTTFVIDYTIRPSIRQVINALNFEAPLPALPSKLPVPMYYAPPMSMCKFSYASSGITADSERYRAQCSCSSCSTNSSMLLQGLQKLF